MASGQNINIGYDYFLLKKRDRSSLSYDITSFGKMVVLNNIFEQFQNRFIPDQFGMRIFIKYKKNSKPGPQYNLLYL